MIMLRLSSVMSVRTGEKLEIAVWPTDCTLVQNHETGEDQTLMIVSTLEEGGFYVPMKIGELAERLGMFARSH